MTSIGYNCFEGCSGLTSLTLPYSVTSIGTDCFAGCDGLTSVTLPASITSLPEGCFRGCTSLPALTIPDSVTSVGSDCFSGCTDLTLTIPDHVQIPASKAFRSCTNFNLYFLGKAPRFSDNGSSSTFYDSTGSVHFDPHKPGWITAAFHDYGGTINWVPSLDYSGIGGKCGFNAFWFLREDGTMILSGTTGTDSYSLSTIDQIPFAQYRDSITRIVVEEGVATLGSYFFYGCSNLTSVTLPNSNVMIGIHCFDGCGKLKGITYADKAPADSDDLPVEMEVFSGSEPFALDLSFLPEEIRPDVTFASSDDTIASVDENGIVTLTGKPGTVTITVTDPEGRVEPVKLLLSVDEHPAPDFLTALTNIPASGLPIGEEAHLTVYAGREVLAPESLTYTVTSGAAHVRVDPDSTIHALSPGYAVIRADLETAEGKLSVSISVYVSQKTSIGFFFSGGGVSDVPYYWDTDTQTLYLNGSPKADTALYLGSVVPIFQTALSAASSNISFTIAPDGTTARVNVALRDISRLVGGKSYTIPVLVYAQGQAANTAAVKCNLTLSVSN